MTTVTVDITSILIKVYMTFVALKSTFEKCETAIYLVDAHGKYTEVDDLSALRELLKSHETTLDKLSLVFAEDRVVKSFRFIITWWSENALFEILRVSVLDTKGERPTLRLFHRTTENREAFSTVSSTLRQNFVVSPEGKGSPSSGLVVV